MDTSNEAEFARMGTGKKKSSRGSTNNKRRLAGFRGREKKGTADWGSCDSLKLQEVVVQITQMGGAVTLSLSRDQGAHGMTLLLDDERKTLWFNGDADLDDELNGVLAVLQAND